MNIKKVIVVKFKSIFKRIKKLIEPKYLIPENKFSSMNYGIIKRLNNIKPLENISNRDKFKKKIIEAYGIQVEYPLKPGLVDFPQLFLWLLHPTKQRQVLQSPCFLTCFVYPLQ